MNRRNIAPNAALAIFAGLLCLGLTIGADRVFGRAVYGPAGPGGLLLEPNSIASYDAVDFHFTAKINSLGFRDREFSLRRSTTKRVLAIGDSYTYGWGVAAEQSWPKQLEADLRREGMDVEVANLGSPGASPRKYADIARKAIDLLKPDLVIVGILQGDDIEQFREPPTEGSTRSGIGAATADAVRRVAHVLYPNLLHFRAHLGRQRYETTEVSQAWKDEAESILSSLGAAERERYDRLDPTVQAAFKAGRLNPPLIQSGLLRPDYWTDTADSTSAQVHRLEDSLAFHLKRIKDAATAANAQVVALSIPMGHYVSRSVFDRRRSYGFTMIEQMLLDDTPDEEIRSAAKEAGVSIISVLHDFRDARDEPFYFKFDTHLDALGHTFLADKIAPTIRVALHPPNG